MKSEQRDYRMNNAIVEPKLSTQLMECERLVTRMGVVFKPGSISPPNICVPSHLYHNRNTFPLRLDAKKTSFSRGRCTSKVCSLPSRLREKMKSSIFKGTLGCDDTDFSRVYPFFTILVGHYNISDLIMVLFTGQGTSAIAQFKKFDPTFEKQHHI